MGKCQDLTVLAGTRTARKKKANLWGPFFYYLYRNGRLLLKQNTVLGFINGVHPLPKGHFATHV